MSSQPLVSIVIIFLNAERYLPETIDSVFAQTYNKWELLLVDDGSSDASTQFAHKLAKKYPDKVQYLEHENHQNRGMSASRNIGIRHARGDLVALLDSDDVWFEDKLERQVEILQQHPDVALLFSNTYFWNAEKNERTLQDFTLSPGRYASGGWLAPILAHDSNAACPAAVLLRREFLLQNGGFEERFRRMYEDQVMWLKTTLHAPVYFDGEPRLLYRIHEESACGSDSLAKKDSERAAAYMWLLDYSQRYAREHPNFRAFQILARCRLCQTLLALATHSTSTQNINQKTLRRRQMATLRRKHRLALGPWFSLIFSLGQFSTRLVSLLCNRIFSFAAQMAKRA